MTRVQFFLWHLQQSCLLGEGNAQLELIESLLVPCNNVDRLHKEIQVLRKQIEEQEISLDAHSHSDYTLEDISRDLAEVMEQLYVCSVIAAAIVPQGPLVKNLLESCAL